MGSGRFFSGVGLSVAFLALLGVGLGVDQVSAQNTASLPQPQVRLLAPLSQPKWSDLSAEHQKNLAPFGAQWDSLPGEERRAWLDLANRIPKMAENERNKASERIVEWAKLSPEQRRLARQNYRLAKTLPAEQRLAQWENYQTLTPQQQQVLRNNGSTSNTAALHAGSRTALAKTAAQPISQNLGVTSRKPSRTAKPMPLPADSVVTDAAPEPAKVLVNDPAAAPEPTITPALAPASERQ